MNTAGSRLLQLRCPGRRSVPRALPRQEELGIGSQLWSTGSLRVIAQDIGPVAYDAAA